MSGSLDRLHSTRREALWRGRCGAASEDDVFEKLGIDSFQAVELMSELELEFDVEIPDYELQGVRTFGQLAATIDKRR